MRNAISFSQPRTKSKCFQWIICLCLCRAYSLFMVNKRPTCLMTFLDIYIQFQDCCPTGHRILPSCGCNAHETIAENISLHRSNCSIFKLTNTVHVTLFTTKPEFFFFRFRVFFRACPLQNNVGEPSFSHFCHN